MTSEQQDGCPEPAAWIARKEKWRAMARTGSSHPAGCPGPNCSHSIPAFRQGKTYLGFARGCPQSKQGSRGRRPLQTVSQPPSYVRACAFLALAMVLVHGRTLSTRSGKEEVSWRGSVQVWPENLSVLDEAPTYLIRCSFSTDPPAGTILSSRCLSVSVCYCLF